MRSKNVYSGHHREIVRFVLNPDSPRRGRPGGPIRSKIGPLLAEGFDGKWQFCAEPPVGTFFVIICYTFVGCSYQDLNRYKFFYPLSEVL